MRNDDKKLLSFSEHELKHFLDSLIEKYANAFDASSTKFIKEREVHQTLKRLLSRDKDT